MTPMLVLVPPTSKKIPSETRRYMRAPATLAAGPESMVRMGRLRISATSMRPPSPRMIMRGASMWALRTLRSVMSAVSIIFGRMEAFTTAVRVRTVSPYSLVIALPPQAGKPSVSATPVTRCSLALLSTPNASLATMTRAPWRVSPSSVWRTASGVRSAARR
jgi:hypothetical protein